MARAIEFAMSVENALTLKSIRIDVRKDGEDQWYQSYGNENWEFDESGLMACRITSINPGLLRSNM